MIRRIGEQATIAAGLTMFAVGMVLVVIPTLGTLTAGVFIVGAGIPWAVVGFGTLLQRRTPWYLVGRVSAASEVMFSVPQTISIVTGAALIGIVGHVALLSVLAGVFLGCGIWLTVRPDRDAPGRDEQPAAVSGRAAEDLLAARSPGR
jgi:hypothetical protein